MAWLSNVVLQQNAVAADDAGLEYSKWAGLGAGAYESMLTTNPSEATLQNFLSADPLNYASGESESTPESTSNEGYCLYEPPAPDSSQYGANIYSNQGTDQDCYTPCTDILSDCPPDTPSESQFVAWGTADADEKSFNNSAFPAVANDVAEAIGFGAAAVGAGATGAALALSPALASALTGTTLAATLSPFGGIAASSGASLTAAQLAEASAGVAAADIGAVVGIVLAAIAVGVIEGFNIISAAEVPGELAQMIYDAPTNPPDLASMLQSSSATTELYSLFIGSTLPEPSLATCDNTDLLAIGGPNGQVSNPAPCLNAPAIPASSGDPTFNITEKGSTTPTTSSTLTWSDAAQGSTNSAYVVGSWFVNTETSDNTSLTAQSLDIHYTNWTGNEDVAWLTDNSTTGYRFVTYEPDTTTPIDPSTCETDGTCSLSSSIDYVGTDGNDYSATLTGTYVPDGDTGVPTTTALTASAANPIVGQQVTLTATISDSSATGTVNFTDGSTTLCANAPVTQAEVDTPEGNGLTLIGFEAEATCSTSFSSAGTHQLSAGYSGGAETGGIIVIGGNGPANWDEASQGTLALDVTKQVATTTVVSASPSSPVVGEQIDYTATVSDPGGPAPTGTVTFTNGNSTLCAEVPLSGGTAACYQTYQSTGLETITASYAGDGGTKPSSGQSSVTIGQATSTTSVSPSTTTPVVGQPVTYTSTVAVEPADTSGPAPTGSVTFTSGATTLCVVPLSATVTCTETYQAPGNETVIASYSGDSNTFSSSGQASVTVGQAATSTALSDPDGSLTFGQAFTLGAQVTAAPPSSAGPAPTGTVTFDVDGQQLGTPVALSANGQAQSLPVTNLAPGTHNVSATYSGDTNYQGSTTASTETVKCSQTITATYNGPLTVSNSTCVEGGTVSGPVNVQPGGTLALIGAKVNGPITTKGITGALVCGTTIQGSVTMTNGTGPLALGGPTGSSCAADKISGPLTISGQQGPVSLAETTVSGPVALLSGTGPVNVSESSVGPLEVSLDSGAVNLTGDNVNGPLTVTYDTGGVFVSADAVNGPATVSSNSSSLAPVVEGNTVGGPLACSSNTPPPTDAGTANKVTGPSQGQCAKLG